MNLYLKSVLLPVMFLLPTISEISGQEQPKNYTAHFHSAYVQSPDVPEGILEAVAWTNTHITHLTPSNTAESCTGIPFSYGVMGLVLDGKSYFRNSLTKVAEISGYTSEEIISSPEINILAYAQAFSKLQQEKNIFSQNPADFIPVLIELSELPVEENWTDDFVINSFLYSVFSFLKNEEFQKKYGFPKYKLDLEKIFGAKNYKTLSSSFVSMSSKRSVDYSPALWNPTTCNYSSRSGTAISAVTIHTAQGSYAGTISWFKNCSSQVSAHYVIRSSDGQVTQVLAESEKGWHVRTENPYTIGIEHEGYVNDSSWYTVAMYGSSANLVKDITNSGYGINPLSTYKGTDQTVINECYRIKGHVHFPNQTHTDPGPLWNWQRYYDLINNSVASFTLTSCTGTFSDNGGTASNYSNLEKYLTVIEPPGATYVTLNFSVFNMEENFDFLHIYDGGNTNAPLIGSFTGSVSPGIITSNSGKIAMLFESDCIFNEDGWQAAWTCSYGPPTFIAGVKETSIEVYPNPVTNFLLLRISSTSFPGTKITIFDSQGKNIFSKKININSVEEKIDFTSFALGIYQLMIQTADNTYSRKIVKL